MKFYRVEKWNTKTEECVADYGTMCEEDMELVVRGYKRETCFDQIMYTRKGSKWLFMVDEVK